MKKSIFPLIIGVMIAFGLFWVVEQTDTSSHSSGDLPKKSFAKSAVVLDGNEPVASTLETSKVSTKEKVKTITTSKQTDTKHMDEGDFIKLADTFMQEIVQPADENNKVTDFNTKAELINHLSKYASQDIAASYVDGLYEEKADGLYIIPTELPPWIMKGEPSELIKLDEENYQLNQKIENNDLYGTYVIQLSFTKHTDQWVIQSVDVK